MKPTRDSRRALIGRLRPPRLRLLSVLALLKDVSARDSKDAERSAGFVDDVSQDWTWPLVEQRCAAGAFVHGLKLSRTHGHRSALLAGLLDAAEM